MSLASSFSDIVTSRLPNKLLAGGGIFIVKQMVVLFLPIIFTYCREEGIVLRPCILL